MNNVILGAGITGLTAGINVKFPIYEASAVPGGICRSYYKGGYRFENGGGHWIFGSGKAIEFIKKFVELKKYKRRASVLIEEKIPYPVQDYFNINEVTPPGTLKEWLWKKFGNEQCRLFFYPFNRKYTDGLFDTIIQDDIQKSPDPKTAGYNDEFYYPDGGLDTFVSKLALRNDIRYNKEAFMIDLKAKKVFFTDGEIVNYDRLISTIPLKKLLELCGIEAPDLIYTSVSVLNIGAKRGENCPEDHWLYIPNDYEMFHRVGFYTNISKDFSFLPGSVGIYVETSYKGEKPVEYYSKKRNELIIKQLQDREWIGQVDVADENWIEYAYTWLLPDHKRSAYINMLKDHGIESIGRYGKWKFQGMADSIMDGLQFNLRQ